MGPPIKQKPKYFSRGCVLLDLFLRESDMTQTELGKKMGLTPLQINHIIRGRRQPSLQLVVAFEEITDGRIRAEEWLQSA